MIWNRPELRRRKKIEYSEVITESGKWTAPYSGRYDLELHGGGGAEGTSNHVAGKDYDAYPGGGSGQLESDVRIEKGTVFTVTIGKGGQGLVGITNEGAGGSTSMTAGEEQSYRVSGGWWGRRPVGTASGNLASGSKGRSTVGNYGDGGYGALSYPENHTGVYPTRPGQPGAVIITYKGA